MTMDDFMTDVVGESYYFGNLAKCYRDRNAIDCQGGKVVKVQLIKEPTNKYDKNAVGVYSAHGQIGHLSRADAKKYHKIIPNGLNATVDCRIWTEDPNAGIYGAWLAFDLDNPPVIAPPDPIKPKRKKLFGLF